MSCCSSFMTAIIANRINNSSAMWIDSLVSLSNSTSVIENYLI